MTIIGWKLWRALNSPPRRHPLFQYVLTHADRSERRVTTGFFMWAFMISSLVFFWVIVFDWVFYLLLAAMIAINMIYGLRWALRISKTIVEEKSHNRFDLLAALPVGRLGTSWAISLGCVHRRPSFRVMPYVILLSMFIAAGMLIFILSTTVIILENVSIDEQTLLENINIIQLAVLGIPVVILFYVDHLYTILTAVLIGQLATVDKRDVTEAQIQSGLLFVTAQMIFYLLAAALGIVVLPALTGSLLSIIPGVFSYFALREWFINRLWNRLKRVCDADENEIRLVFSNRYMVDQLNF